MTTYNVTSNGQRTGHSQAFFDTVSHVLHVDTAGAGHETMTITLTGVSGSDLGASNFVWS